MDDAQLTLTSGDPQRVVRPRSIQVPYLYLVIECDRPKSLPMRFCLADLSRIEIGRGVERAHARQDGGAMRLGVPDRCMSGKHASVEHADDGRWVLRDLGSKNGSFVNGVQVHPGGDVALEDGDVVELGHTFFRFRKDVAPAAGASVLDAAVLVSMGVPAGLRTLVPALEQTYANVAKLAASSSSLLLLGETGTGKEVVAKSIHELSGKTGSFVGVNCGALPANLVESELFGSKKGAFSGANEDRIGLVRASDNGTLLLDEVGDLPLTSQASLLRVLQESEVMPVGASKPVPVKLRVVAATHHDLETLASNDRFRRDLHARLNGFTVRLLPLRERREDIGMLVAALAERIEAETPFAITPDAMRLLMRYDFPLNVRELEQVLRAALVLAPADPGTRVKTIDVDHLPETVKAGPRNSAPGSKRRTVAASPEATARKAELIVQMKEHRGNVSAIARAMGTARMQIHRWIRQFEVNPEDYRE